MNEISTAPFDKTYLGLSPNARDFFDDLWFELWEREPPTEETLREVKWRLAEKHGMAAALEVENWLGGSQETIKNRTP